jgi:RNA polymerase primary sigma factor
MRQPAVFDYARDIKNFRPLSAEDERGLVEAAKRGDAEVKDRLVHSCLWLVVKIARSYVGLGMPLEDLVGEGNLGLLKAANRFDPKFGTRFSTYATWWIKQSISEAFLNRFHTIRVPRHMARILSDFNRTKRALHQTTGREPTVDEVAAALDLSDRQKHLLVQAQVAKAIRVSSSYEAVLGDRFLGSVPDTSQSVDVDEAARDECAAIIRRMRWLDPDEYSVITRRFGLGGEAPMSLREIGKLMGMSKQGVHNIEARAKNKLSVGHRDTAQAQRA